MLCYDMLGIVMLCYIALYCVTSCCIILCCVVSYYITLCLERTKGVIQAFAKCPATLVRSALSVRPLWGLLVLSTGEGPDVCCSFSFVCNCSLELHRHKLTKGGGPDLFLSSSFSSQLRSCASKGMIWEEGPHDSIFLLY